MVELYDLKKKLDRIDAELAAHRGPESERQIDLLRWRRETILELRDRERAYWGD